MFALGAIQTLKAVKEKKEKVWWALNALCHWPTSKQKIFHRRQFLMSQISSYGTLALDSPELKPGTLLTRCNLASHKNAYCRLLLALYSIICPVRVLDQSSCVCVLTTYHTLSPARNFSTI